VPVRPNRQLARVADVELPVDREIDAFRAQLAEVERVVDDIALLTDLGRAVARRGGEMVRKSLKCAEAVDLRER
jgi:hypothetical protein